MGAARPRRPRPLKHPLRPHEQFVSDNIPALVSQQALQPTEQDAGELRDHVIIAGFGRVGQIIAQLLSERLIPFVALDVSAERVQVPRYILPSFFPRKALRLL